MNLNKEKINVIKGAMANIRLSPRPGLDAMSFGHIRIGDEI